MSLGKTCPDPEGRGAARCRDSEVFFHPGLPCCIQKVLGCFLGPQAQRQPFHAETGHHSSAFRLWLRPEAVVRRRSYCSNVLDYLEVGMGLGDSL